MSVVEGSNTHYALPEGLEPEFRIQLSDDLMRFQGVWCGSWGGHIPQVLVIDRIQRDATARFVYAWGDSIHSIRDFRKGSFQLRNQPLSLELSKGSVEFEIIKPDRLFGTYREAGAIVNCVTLSRIADAESTDSVSVLSLRVPIETSEGTLHDEAPSLYCTVYRDTRRNSAPLLLFNHGSADSLGPTVTWLYDSQARYFASLGFTVVVPMRRGRGKSDGPFIESGIRETEKFFGEEMSAGVSDVFAVLRYLRHKSWASQEPVVLAGQSRGGYLSLVCAAEAPDEIRAVVNYSGGWWDEKSPAASFQIRELRRAGAKATTPTIWLYGENDDYYSPIHIHEMHDAYTGSGGIADLHLFHSVGHEVVEHTHLWDDHVSAFVESIS